MHMVTDALGKSRALTVPSEPDEVLDRVVVLYSLYFLFNNGPCIQVTGHIVTCGTD